MSAQVIYEWVAEPVDEHGDIIDPLYGESFKEAWEADVSQFSDATGKNVALVRYVGSEYDGEIDRDYFYVREGELQPNECGDVPPKRFRDEVVKYFRQGNSV